VTVDAYEEVVVDRVVESAAKMEDDDVVAH
jgi:hypothetical protein